MKIFYCIVIIGCFCACKPKQHKIKKVLTYLQVNDQKAYKSEESNFDTLGRIVETIKYEEGGQIHTVEKTSYDSLGRKSLFTITEFRNKELPCSSNFYCIYDKQDLLIREMRTMSYSPNDTLVGDISYDKEKKMIKRKITINIKESSWYTGVERYYYDNQKRLIKKRHYDLDEKSYCNYDSIVYEKNTKTIFEFHSAGKLSSKEVHIYVNGKITEIKKYGVKAFSDEELYLDSKEIYTYNHLDSLSKKQTKHYARVDWCGHKHREWNYIEMYIYQ